MDIDTAFKLLRAANIPVPKPQRLPSLEEVADVERMLAFPFPIDYRRFQLEASNVNAGCLEPALIVPGITSAYRDLRRLAPHAWEHGICREVLPFCFDNGNYHFIDRCGIIGFWDHEDNSERRGGNLADWIIDVWLMDK